MAVRVRLAQDPFAMFAMMAAGLGGGNGKFKTLGDDEISYLHLPAGKVVVVADNGKKLVLNNKPDHVKKLKEYSIDTSTAVAMPVVTHALGIDNGDFVYIESID